MKQNWFQCAGRLGENKYIIAGARGSVLFLHNTKIKNYQ